MNGRRPAMKRRSIAALALSAVVLTGCGTTAGDLPLPGSSQPGKTYEVKAVFDDAVNLAQGAAVKVNGISVGRVSDITVKDFKAHVTMDIAADRQIASDAEFRLRVTTALGELFVDVIEDEASGSPLSSGAEVAPENATAAPTVEDTLAAASLFLNGGGLGQFQVIVDELNYMVGGREDDVKKILQRITTTASAITDSSGDIDLALRSLASVSQTLNQREGTINAALREIRPAAAVVRESTQDIIALLKAIDHFGDTTIGVIDGTREDLMLILRESGPIFDQVNAIEGELTDGIAAFIDFSTAIDSAVPTEYLNVDLEADLLSLLNLDLLSGLGLGGAAAPQAAAEQPGSGLLDTLPLDLGKTVENLTGETLGLNRLLTGLTGGAR